MIRAGPCGQVPLQPLYKQLRLAYNLAARAYDFEVALLVDPELLVLSCVDCTAVKNFVPQARGIQSYQLHVRQSHRA